MTCNNCGELKLIEISGVVEFIGCMCDGSGIEQIRIDDLTPDQALQASTGTDRS